MDSYSNRYSDVSALRVSRSAKAFPGSLALATPRIATTITIDGNYGQQAQKIPYGQWDEPVWRSTGLYAPPGQLVAVTLAKTSVAGQGLLVQVRIEVQCTVQRSDQVQDCPCVLIQTTQVRSLGC